MSNAFEKTEEGKELTYSEGVKEVLDTAGLEHEDFLVNDSVFDQVIISRKDQPVKEKMVRVYRGVRNTDQSLLEQLPYAMRTIVEHEGKRGVKKLTELKEDVDILANSPSYPNLLNYVSKVRPQLQDSEVKYLDEDLEKIEDYVIKGKSIREIINFIQVMHGAGSADSGISPFVSASTDAKEAAKYGNLVMVMDVPVSLVSQTAEPKHGEVMLKGVIDQQYITAYLTKHNGPSPKDEKLFNGLDKALGVLAANDQTSVYTPEEMLIVRKEQAKKEAVQDQAQHQKDLELILGRRIDRLIKKYPEANLDLSNVQSQAEANNIDVYTQGKRIVLADLADRLKKIYSDGTDEDVQFEMKEMAQRNRLSENDINNISEEFLSLLHQRVLRMELRARERAAEQSIRKSIQES